MNRPVETTKTTSTCCFMEAKNSDEVTAGQMVGTARFTVWLPPVSMSPAPTASTSWVRRTSSTARLARWCTRTRPRRSRGRSTR